MKRVPKRQREILNALLRKDGQRAFGLSGSQSNNVLERMLALGLIRAAVTDGVIRIYITSEGMEAK